MSIIDNTRYKIEINEKQNFGIYTISGNSYDERIKYYQEYDNYESCKTITMTSELLSKKDIIK